MNDATAPEGRPRSADDVAGRTSDQDRTRRRRRFWLVYGLVAVVGLVLAATTTVPGPPRLVTIGVVVIAIAGFVAVVPWVRRYPPPGAGEERTFSGGSVLGGPAMIITANLIRSVGPDDGGWAALPATIVASALLVLPMIMLVDAAARRRRARKNAAQA